MNKNLEKLMLEAGYAAPEIALRAQKLAELVVIECASIVENQGRFLTYTDLTAKIRKQFGVKI
jgi:DNA-directed RNA polymerase delta subunit